MTNDSPPTNHGAGDCARSVMDSGRCPVCGAKGKALDTQPCWPLV